MINIPVWMFISSYEKLRKSILENNTYSSMLHLGRGIFGSDFGTTSFVIFKQHIDNYKGNYRRLFEKQGAVDSIDEKEQKFFFGQGSFVACQENFAKIPGAPVAYWVSEKLLQAYRGTVLSDVSNPCKGIDTGNNDMFLRFWFEPCNTVGEIPICNKWYPYNKGGSYRKWYGNNDYVIYWGEDGTKLREFRGSNLRNKDYYFKEGITWSTVTSADISLRYFGRNYLFDNGGCCLFAEKNILYIQGLLNSIVGKTFLAISPTINFQPGDVGKVPYNFSDEYSMAIKSNVKENISLSKADWDSFETSWDFERHPLV